MLFCGHRRARQARTMTSGRFTARCAQGAENAEGGVFLNRRERRRFEKLLAQRATPILAAKRLGGFPLPASLPCEIRRPFHWGPGNGKNRPLCVLCVFAVRIPFRIARPSYAYTIVIALVTVGVISASPLRLLNRGVFLLGVHDFLN